MRVRRAIVAGLLLLCVASSARAQDGRVADRAAEAEVAGTGAGAPARRVMPPAHDMDLQAALDGAEPEVRRCIEESMPGMRVSLRARVRVSLRRGVTISQTMRPRSAQAEACVDLAIRRWVQPLLSRPMPSPLSGTLRVAIGGVVIPPPPPPPPPLPPPPGRYDEGQVHAALDAMRASLIECVPDLSPGIAGRMTLRVSVRPDGSLTLMGVQLPSGVRGGGSLSCLASRVTWLRVPPPPGERLVVHHVDLGRL
ncbi:hypothetical protein [Sandaracinus amylolyticus]|uniref:hypothetical protein n=1 Tax=Sandaracinus amylolyticus TaxID=927083 RepID=UPI001F42EC85|nr:hypothetical protein [Sandaracinus amylolyticus]